MDPNTKKDIVKTAVLAGVFIVGAFVVLYMAMGDTLISGGP